MCNKYIVKTRDAIHSIIKVVLCLIFKELIRRKFQSPQCISQNLELEIFSFLHLKENKPPHPLQHLCLLFGKEETIHGENLEQALNAKGIRQNISLKNSGTPFLGTHITRTFHQNLRLVNNPSLASRVFRMGEQQVLAGNAGPWSSFYWPLYIQLNNFVWVDFQSYPSFLGCLGSEVVL